MGFVQRAFTPPGTGGREAAEIQAVADAQAAAQKAAQANLPKMPSAPEAPKPPAAAPQFMAGSAPGARQRAAMTSTMLGAAASAGQQAKKSVLG
jgi:hypothetical protein